MRRRFRVVAQHGRYAVARLAYDPPGSYRVIDARTHRPEPYAAHPALRRFPDWRSADRWARWAAEDDATHPP